MLPRYVGNNYYGWSPKRGMFGVLGGGGYWWPVYAKDNSPISPGWVYATFKDALREVRRLNRLAREVRR